MLPIEFTHQENSIHPGGIGEDSQVVTEFRLGSRLARVVGFGIIILWMWGFGDIIFGDDGCVRVDGLFLHNCQELCFTHPNWPRPAREIEERNEAV